MGTPEVDETSLKGSPSSQEFPGSPSSQELSANPTRQVEGTRPECFSSTATECLYIASSTMASASLSMIVGSVTVIASLVGEDLDLTNAEITWMPAASSLTCGAFLLFFGRFADLFGRKILYVISMFLMAVFALAAGFSKTGLIIDALNGALGLCAASAVPPAIGSLGYTYGKGSKRKNRAFACYSAGNPLGYILGSLLSGVATRLFNWRASFWLLALIFLVTAIVAVFTMPADRSKKLPFNRQTLLRFDLGGAALTVCGVGMFTSALTIGGSSPSGWGAPQVIALLVVGVLLLVAFVFWESRYQYPLLPMWIWKDKNFSLICLIMFLSFCAFPTSLFWTTLYVQRTWTGTWPYP